MRFRTTLIGWTAALLLGFTCCFGALAASAQQDPTRIPAKNLSEKQCLVYGNVKATFPTEGTDTLLRLEFGTGDGVFGGAWFSIPAPKFENTPCHAIALTLRGNGKLPGKAFLFLKTENGGVYRSKDLASLFAQKEWQELLLNAQDFIIDPAGKPEVNKNLPKQPLWTDLRRIDISAVSLESEPTLELKAISFALGAAPSATTASSTPLAAPTLPPPAKPADPASKYPGLVLQNNAGNDALTPVAKGIKFPEGSWLERHEKFVARAKQGDVDLLWLGDSITDNWNNAKGTYRKLFPNVKSANFGIGGDGTQNLLWRLENGELDGLQPKVAIVLIGTNNVQWHQSAQIAAAIEKIVKTIRTHCPKTNVLLMALFPRADVPASSPAHQRIREVNALISKLDDGRNVRYLDIRAKLTNADDTILDDAFADKVHLSPKGFTIWAESMQPLLDEMNK